MSRDDGSGADTQKEDTEETNTNTRTEDIATDTKGQGLHTEEGDEDVLPKESLTWRDYGALLIALAQTVLLPFLLALVFLFLLFLGSAYLL